MKNKNVVFGVCALIVAGALVCIWVVRAERLAERNAKWLAAYHATSTCNKVDDDYFLSMLSGNETGEIADAQKAELLTKIGSSCQVLSAEGNFMVAAFDKNFRALSNADKLEVFEKMSDPSSFFTKHILSSEAEWSHLNVEQVSALLPTFAGFSDSRKAIVANKYGAELRAVSIDQRDAFVEATKKLESNALPGQAEDFQKNLKELNASLGKLAQIDTLVAKVQGRGITLANAAAALDSASQAYTSLVKNGDLTNYTLQEVVVGQQLFVPRATGHYYLGQLSEDLRKVIQLSANPTYQEQEMAILARGPSALHTIDGDAILRPGRYNFWLRTADIDDQISSPANTWFATYEIADAKTQAKIIDLKRSENELIFIAKQLVLKLNSNPVALGVIPVTEVATVSANEPNPEQPDNKTADELSFPTTNLKLLRFEELPKIDFARLTDAEKKILKKNGVPAEDSDVTNDINATFKPAVVKFGKSDDRFLILASKSESMHSGDSFITYDIYNFSKSSYLKVKDLGSDDNSRILFAVRDGILLGMLKVEISTIGNAQRGNLTCENKGTKYFFDERSQVFKSPVETELGSECQLIKTGSNELENIKYNEKQSEILLNNLFQKLIQPAPNDHTKKVDVASSVQANVTPTQVEFCKAQMKAYIIRQDGDFTRENAKAIQRNCTKHTREFQCFIDEAAKKAKQQGDDFISMADKGNLEEQCGIR